MEMEGEPEVIKSVHKAVLVVAPLVSISLTKEQVYIIGRFTAIHTWQLVRSVL